MLKRILVGVCMCVAGVGAGAAGSVDEAVGSLRAAASGPVNVTYSPVTGAVTFLSVRPGSELRVSRASSASAEDRARAFVADYGRAFGLPPVPELRTERTERDALGVEHVRFRQLHNGVPVTGGELIVHLRGDAVVAANGKLVPDLEGIGTEPVIAAGTAGDLVAEVLRKHLGVTDAVLGEPRLELFNRGLLEGRHTPTRLAWFVEARRLDLREYVWIDAVTGQVLLQFSQLADAKYRSVYTANSGATLPGTLLYTEGGGPAGDADADSAYEFAGITYDYYLSQHGRDSYDDGGGELRSTVHYCPSVLSCPYANAFWNGSQMVYGDTYASADDVVAHELTHAVTERTAGLFYYMQSGAMNESFSDIFGETVDLSDGVGSDGAGVRWEMGEDLPIGAIRDMMTPTVFGDPGKVSDAYYKCYSDGTDSGGVHSNSGVPNHAYALMVDGGSYNGYTVTGIGLTKAAKIQYRALTRYLVSASDFQDDADALYRSCMDLVGSAGITGADCTQVENALAAVEMSLTPSCVPTQVAVPDLCPAGQAPVDWALVDFETPFGFTPCPADDASSDWCDNSSGSVLGQFATSGTHSLWGYDWGTTADRWATISWGGALPANARLQFNHSFGFEDDLTHAYDGGVVEYSTDGGSNWSEASSLFSSGASYNGTISTCCGNPLGGRSAFVRDSWGYTATQLDLASLAGQTFAIRFRIGTDRGADDYGWFVDDVRVYQCAEDPLIFSDGFETGTMGAWSVVAP